MKYGVEAVQPKGNTWERQRLIVIMRISAVCILRCMIHYKVIEYSVPVRDGCMKIAS